jgi:hypothetical protein
MTRTSKDVFLSDSYIRHNMRRLEHLTSLGLPIQNRTVLELGAGIGDHTMFYLDRGCSVVSLEGREENVVTARERLEKLKASYPEQSAEYRTFDLEEPEVAEQGAPINEAEIIHCYGILYHLRQPLPMLRWARAKCTDIMILETAVSPGEDETLRRVKEDDTQASQALDGVGSRPTRAWVFNTLRRLFPYTYIPATQPAHEEFPTDWRTSQLHDRPLIRAVFIASLRPLGQLVLLGQLPVFQSRV